MRARLRGGRESRRQVLDRREPTRRTEERPRLRHRFVLLRQRVLLHHRVLDDGNGRAAVTGVLDDQAGGPPPAADL